MKRWQFWLGVVIGLLCILLALSRIEDWSKFADAFLSVKYIYIFPIVASYFFMMLLRAIRWRYILNQTGNAGFGSVWSSLMICYMGNNIFPLRAGELMRVFMVGKLEEEISYSSALATVVVERLFDFLFLLVVLALVLILIEFPADRLMITISGGQYDFEAVIKGLGTGTLIAALLLFVFLILLNSWTDQILSITGWFLKVFPEKFSEKILDLLSTFADGLVIMGRPKALFILAGMSILVWASNIFPVWLSAQAFGIELGLTECMFMIVAGSAAASIPGPPGFFGTFHAFNQAGLVFLMGTDSGLALSFAVILHAGYYFPLTLAGFFEAWRKGYSLTQLKEGAQEAESKKESIEN
jgi:glycosyltransferase 2 family protein